MKTLATLLCCAFWLGFALVPEAIMYGVYHLINPETQLVKIILLMSFWFGGASMCILFAVLGFLGWANTMKEIIK